MSPTEPVGIPVIAPVVVFSVRPAGRATAPVIAYDVGVEEGEVELVWIW